MTWWATVVVLVASIGGAIWLLWDAAIQRSEWAEHHRQVTERQKWESSRVTSPFDQDHAEPPRFASPYAAPGAPPLPPRPGAGNVLWAVILVVVAVIVLLAFLARLAS